MGSIQAYDEEHPICDGTSRVQVRGIGRRSASPD